jgi:hypothetical protein
MYSGKIAVPPGGGGIVVLYFALNKLSTEKVLCITRLENVLQVVALVAPRLTPLLHKPCLYLHLQNGIF